MASPSYRPCPHAGREGPLQTLATVQCPPCSLMFAKCSQSNFVTLEFHLLFWHDAPFHVRAIQRTLHQQADCTPTQSSQTLPHRYKEGQDCWLTHHSTPGAPPSLPYCSWKLFFIAHSPDMEIFLVDSMKYKHLWAMLLWVVLENQQKCDVKYSLIELASPQRGLWGSQQGLLGRSLIKQGRQYSLEA